MDKTNEGVQRTMKVADRQNDWLARQLRAEDEVMSKLLNQAMLSIEFNPTKKFKRKLGP